MKTEKNSREQLGIMQKEFAMLLGVGRSQLAMYESGKRDLPLLAKLKLTQIITFVQQTDILLKDDDAHLKMQELKKQKMATKQMLINQHRQLIIEKKIKAIEKRYVANTATLRLVNYMQAQTTSII